MIDIVLLGLNHETAPVAERECIAFSGDQARDALPALTKHAAIREALLFSTCNRVEVLLATPAAGEAVEAATNFIAEYNNIPAARFRDYLYIHRGDAAVRHVFRVASSLDSLVLGEPQILGQVKEAYRMASAEKATGVVLNRLLHRTFFVAKRIRSETGIGDHAVSISYAAIELGRKIFDTLEEKQVLLIGAGEMAELAVEHLIRNRVGEILVANRTFERGVKLAARFKGKALRFEEIPEALKRVDIIISSTGAPGFVIDKAQVKGVMRSRRNRPLFFIDIAVPRDIDPKINRLGNTYVYDIDDLKGVIDENIEDRRREALKAERIVDEAVIKFRLWMESLDVVPTVKALRRKMDGIAGAEIKRTLQSLKHFSDQDQEAIQRLAHSMINKILHDPTLFLKGQGCHGDKAAYIDFTRKLFKLDDGGGV
ncbi:MAG: glutamyl-tRNA reductase [Desulfobacterales bacterium]|nr:glutamyl-tRNA reductase [Desulfobacterales bacterium]